MFGFFFTLALIAPGQLGGGDVKLAALIGVTLGHFGGLLLVFWGVVCIGIIGGLWVLIKELMRKNQAKYIAYGPIMVAGTWLVLFAGVEWGLK